MIKNWLVRGDTHGKFYWMDNGCLNDYVPEETAIIILGDAGFNFFLNKTDDKLKAEVNARGYRFYCVRGNHEARPQGLGNRDFHRLFSHLPGLWTPGGRAYRHP